MKKILEIFTIFCISTPCFANMNASLCFGGASFGPLGPKANTALPNSIKNVPTLTRRLQSGRKFVSHPEPAYSKYIFEKAQWEFCKKLQARYNADRKMVLQYVDAQFDSLVDILEQVPAEYATEIQDQIVQRLSTNPDLVKALATEVAKVLGEK